MGFELLADIGGTNARLALLDTGSAEILSQRVFTNCDFPEIAVLLESYLHEFSPSTPVLRGCLAVAAPVLTDKVQFTNNSWSFDRLVLAARLGIEQLYVINDFEAVSRSLVHLQPQSLHRLKQGSAIPGACLGVVGPGTGFGSGAAVPDGRGGYIPLPCEGGHAAFAPCDAREDYLAQELRREKGFVCVEDFLSGQGLETIYRLLSKRNYEQPRSSDAKTILSSALARSDGLSEETLDTFTSMLGSAAGNHALTVGAKGGFYLAGGIVPRMLDYLENSQFLERFNAKGSYREYVASIPIYAMIGTEPGILGASALLQSFR